MFRTILSILIFAQVALAQSAGSPDAFKKEFLPLQKAIEETIRTSVPGSEILQTAKATYLDEFGIVVAVEIMLERPPNPFEAPKKPADARASLVSRRKVLQEKLELLLKQRVSAMQSIGEMQSMTIVVHVFNPASVPNFPTQIILTVKKQDPTRIIVREF